MGRKRKLPNPKKVHYVADIQLNVQEVTGYIEKVEQLIKCLRKARDLLQELKDMELHP